MFSPTDFWQPSKQDYVSRARAEALLCPSNSQLLEEAPGQWAAGSNLQQIEPSLFPHTQNNLTKPPLSFHPLVYYCPQKGTSLFSFEIIPAYATFCPCFF